MSIENIQINDVGLSRYEIQCDLVPCDNNKDINKDIFEEGTFVIQDHKFIINICGTVFSTRNININNNIATIKTECCNKDEAIQALNKLLSYRNHQKSSKIYNINVDTVIKENFKVTNAIDFIEI